MTPDQKVEALRLADALELEGEPRRSDKYAAADLLRALAAEPAPEPLTDEQIASLVSALNVYADPSFYHACVIMFDPPTGGFDEDFSFDAEYGRDMPGKLARETLDAIDTAKAQPQSCVGNDPLCPCQDGDVCNYRDSGETKAWPVPEHTQKGKT